MGNSDAPAALGVVWAEHRVPLMAALTAALGDLDRAEDALSEAVLRAHRSWSAALPSNPSGWLYRVALNAARDGYRREATRAKATQIVTTHFEIAADAALEVSPEARLALFRRCADSRLSQDQQIALMLYHLAGLDCAAIARAFLVGEAAIHQRLSRARAKLRSGEGDTSEAGLDAVRSALEVIYLQSYRNVAGGPDADALGRDAVQLAQALCDAAPGEAESWALLALFHAFESRRPARLTEGGRFVPFSAQSISRWSGGAMRRASAAMRKAAKLSRGPTPYALRAQIELTRMIARREGSNRDPELLSLHDALIAHTDAPFARVERALCLLRLDGPQAALAALQSIETDLSGHAGWHLALAEIHAARTDRAQARLHLNAAATLIDAPAERAFVLSRLASLSLDA